MNKTTLRNQMKNYNLFGKIDKISKELNDYIDSNNSPQFLKVQKHISVIETSFSQLIGDIELSKEFNKDAKDTIKNACVLDFHIRLAEKLEVDLFYLLSILQPKHLKEFEKAQNHNPFTK